METVANPFLYTGREWDAVTGLYYYRARYYEPKVGRFLSEDPIGFDGGVNFYRYVENNPVMYVDAMGLSPRDVQRIQNIFRSEVERLTRDGYRRPGSGALNGMLNNLGSSLGKKYLGCWDQSAVVRDRLAAESFDDNWEFKIESLRGGLHKRGIASSQNPTDPVIVFDPWKYEITVTQDKSIYTEANIIE